jgi:hypothetical protein
MTSTETADNLRNIRVYCTSPSSESEGRSRAGEERTTLLFVLTSIGFPGLAFIAYWGIVLFGYDTCVFSLSSPKSRGIQFSLTSGVAGGVVQSTYFQIKFGIRPAEGPARQSRIDNVSGNVVSALQGGAFFGALSSAPVSGLFRFPFQDVQLLQWIVVAMQTCFLHATSSASAGTVPCER